MRLEEAWRTHRAELRGALTDDARREAERAWRDALAARAHGYVDLVERHAARDKLRAAQANAVGEAWLCGVMVRRHWVTEGEARRIVLGIGQGLCDEVRALGLPLDRAGPGVRTAIGGALESVATRSLGAAAD